MFKGWIGARDGAPPATPASPLQIRRQRLIRHALDGGGDLFSLGLDAGRHGIGHRERAALVEPRDAEAAEAQASGRKERNAARERIEELRGRMKRCRARLAELDDPSDDDLLEEWLTD